MNSSGQYQSNLDYFFPNNISYDASIPTPQKYFGFKPGEIHLRHDQLVDYLLEVANISDRISVEMYGKTFEQRQLLLLTISTPENLQNIEQIKVQHKKLGRTGESSSLPLAEMPVVVWMGYSVHGNEASGSNAVPLVVYYLAAAQGDNIENLLKKTIILIDPCINPDGFSRFAQWVNMNRSNVLVSDPNNREHRENWPGGRTNHYWFDLNRDWLLVQQPETKGRLKKFYEWMPNIVNDFHEMGTNNTFFFQPGVFSRTNPLIPKSNIELTSKIAQFHAKALDKIGSLYFSKEVFDDFYFGKGSTYPDLNGGIGILYEQASSRGLVQESVNGMLTFPFAIRNQLTTSLSTLDAAKSLHIELLQHQKDFFISAAKEAQNSKVSAYVFGDTSDPARTFHFLEILQSHQIECYRLAKKYQNETTTFLPGDAYITPVNQTQYLLLKALFDKPTKFSDSLFYDVSSWTLPLAFNLPYAEISGSTETYIGEKYIPAAFPKGILKEVSDPLAYTFSWDGYYAPRALYRLLRNGIKAKVATMDFSSIVDGKEYLFPKGSIVIPLGLQQNKGTLIDSSINKISTFDAIDVYSLNSNRSTSVGDLGSPSIKSLVLPKILVMTESGVSSGQVGEVWHLLDQRMEMEVSLVKKSYINSMDLTPYNVVIMVNGRYNEIDSSGTAKLNRWVKRGGTLLAFENVSRWLNSKNFLQLKWVANKNDPKSKRRSYQLRSADMGKERMSGAIVETNLDLTHPLGYGYKREFLPVFRRNRLYLNPAKDPYSTPLQYTENPLLSGFISTKNLYQLKKSAAIVVKRIGDGRIILFMDNPNFRAFWYGTNKLFLNAIFFGQIIN
jgi:hypothetical protein